MSLLKVLEWPHKILDTKSDPVTQFDDEIKKICSDMHETMEASGGIGLAANQVGILKRIITIKIPYTKADSEEVGYEKQPWHDKSYTFINPEIVKKSQDKMRYLEGCLSFPEIYDYVDRPRLVTVKAYDENGKEFTVELNDLFSICIQHEIDHIDGIVFFKRMSRIKSTLIRKKMQKRVQYRMSKDSE